MGTRIRPELSVKNKYWLDRHRYYELKHFCLQYKKWKTAYAHLDGMTSNCIESAISRTNVHSNPTERCAMAKMRYARYMDMIESVAKETDKVLYPYILKAVTEGLSYDCLKTKFDIPCCKDTYYELYRRFFWLLDRARD